MLCHKAYLCVTKYLLNYFKYCCPSWQGLLPRHWATCSWKLKRALKWANLVRQAQQPCPGKPACTRPKCRAPESPLAATQPKGCKIAKKYWTLGLKPMISWFTSGKQTTELHRWFCYETHFILYIISIAGNVPYVNEPVFVDFGLSVLRVRPATMDPVVRGAAVYSNSFVI